MIKLFDQFSPQETDKYEDYFINLSDNWPISITSGRDFGKSGKLKLFKINISINNSDLKNEIPLIEPSINLDDDVIVYRKSNLFFEFMGEVNRCIDHLTKSNDELKYISMYMPQSDFNLLIIQFQLND